VGYYLVDVGDHFCWRGSTRELIKDFASDSS
jgi:hypothetical protein